MDVWLNDLLTGPGEPGEVYRRALQELTARGLVADYALTESIVYATELRYALDLLAGKGKDAWNFADTGGTNDRTLFTALDAVDPLRLAFVGSGPYPVTARLVLQRYPQARVCCIDNHATGYFVGKAVLEQLELEATSQWADGAAVDYWGYTAVLVAAMVRGKRQIVERALAQCPGPVIVRGRVELEHPRLVTLPAAFTPQGVVAS